MVFIVVLSAQLDPHHRLDLADHPAGGHGRDNRFAAHGHAFRLHGFAGCARLGRRTHQEPDRRSLAKILTLIGKG